MDIKNSLENYENTVRAKINLENIKKSIKIIIESGLPYEFRTTIAPGLINKEDIEKIGELIGGADSWYLQNFKKDTELLDKSLQTAEPLSMSGIEEMREIGKKLVKKCEIR
jgi:pyruvate formate lyase activating enzyme